MYLGDEKQHLHIRFYDIPGIGEKNNVGKDELDMMIDGKLNTDVEVIHATPESRYCYSGILLYIGLFKLEVQMLLLFFSDYHRAVVDCPFMFDEWSYFLLPN